MPVGTHPHLLVVGVGTLLTVPSMVGQGTRRGEVGGSNSRDYQLSGSHVRRAFQIISIRYLR
jgi:hypothetical protein